MADFFRKPMRMRCNDGATRTVYVKCCRYDGSFAADAFFSVPAHVVIKRKYVAGYVTHDEGGLEFRAYAGKSAVSSGARTRGLTVDNTGRTFGEGMCITLTPDGRDYVRDALADLGGSRKIKRLWAEFYHIEPRGL